MEGVWLPLTISIPGYFLDLAAFMTCAFIPVTEVLYLLLSLAYRLMLHLCFVTTVTRICITFHQHLIFNTLASVASRQRQSSSHLAHPTTILSVFMTQRP